MNSVEEIDLILFTQDGAEIKTSTYWDTVYAQRGYFWMSFCCATFRLLTPFNMESQISEMETAKYVVVSRGQYKDRDCIEIMFDDKSQHPYCLQIDREQCDMMPANTDDTKMQCTVWIKGPNNTALCVLRRDAFYRLVKHLPCLEPWKGTK